MATCHCLPILDIKIHTRVRRDRVSALQTGTAVVHVPCEMGRDGMAFPNCIAHVRLFPGVYEATHTFSALAVKWQDHADVHPFLDAEPDRRLGNGVDA